MYSYKRTYLLDKELNTKTGTVGVMSTNSTQKLIYAMYVPSAMSFYSFHTWEHTNAVFSKKLCTSEYVHAYLRYYISKLAGGLVAEQASWEDVPRKAR